MTPAAQFSQSVVYPIPPAFLADESLDLDAISKYLDWLYDNGARVVMTTAGTTRFNLLSDPEIREINRRVARFKGNSIIAFPPLSEKHLGSYLFDLGASKELRSGRTAVMLMYPDRHYNDSDIVDFYFRMADSIEMPVMFHGMFMREATGGTYQYTDKLCHEIKQHHNIIGMKEESLDLNQAYSISKLADNDFVVIPAGGSCRRYIYCQPAGAQTFLGGIGNIWPEIEESYFMHCKESRHQQAWDIVRIFEDPFMAVGKKIGWHKLLQIALEFTQRMPTHTRKPFSEPTEEEIFKVMEVCTYITDSIERNRDLLCTSSG